MLRFNIPGCVSRLTPLLLLSLLGLGAFPAAFGQAPSSQQLDMLRNMTPEQQQAILQSLGGSSTGMGSGLGTSSSRPRTDRNIQFPEVLRRSDLEEDREFSERMGGELVPRLKPLDSLLISLEIREYKGQDATVARPIVPAQDPTQPEQLGAPAPPPPASAQEKIARPEAEVQRLNDLRTRILRRNPLNLDKWGILTLPELGLMPLAGLNVEEARQRLAAEPILSEFVVSVTFLPVKPVGAQALKPFGYELFGGTPSTFAPATDVPVPSEYVVGPGDVFEIQLTGTIKGRYSLVVGRDGRLNFPELGPISVGGQRFEAARGMIEQRVRSQLIGTQVSVQMGELRSIRVFILGDARYPGSYTVSGLSTITNALFVSGGVKKIGSLRNIELKRNGQTVTRLDLYDLLLRGDTHADVRLLPGDVIFIPSAGTMVGVTGEVQRPAYYELKGETSVADLVKLAGGLTAVADSKLATLDRVSEQQQRTVLAVDLTKPASGGTALKNGDVLQVPTIGPVVDDSVMVHGHVHREGKFQFRPGLRISDVLPTLDELQPGADQSYVLIRREDPATRRVHFVSADLVAALAQRGSDADVTLAPRDQLYVFDIATGRDRLMEPLLRELRLQSNYQEPTSEVSISGRVNMPGQYPLEPGMRVSDLIRAGGSLNEAAYGGKAELTRNATQTGEERKTELIDIDLAKAVAGDPAADVELRAFDYLIIKELPLWGAQEYVEVQGEIRFPGRYPIQRGETLRSVIQRAGGMTDLAFHAGAIFTRDTLKEREKEQIEVLTKRLQQDLAQISLTAAQSGASASEAFGIGNQLLGNLRDTQPVGRLVIDMDRSLAAAPGSPQDIVLKNGDRLIVPRVTQEVTVLGEVQSPTSHLFADGLSSSDYVRMSGGATQRADAKRTYVVRANGSVKGGNSNRWFGSSGFDVEPGDTVVVPLDAERVRPLTLWQGITSIISNLAITAAAISSVTR